MSEQPTAEQYAAKFLRQGVEARVQRLRTLADQIEAEAARNLKRAEAGKGTYAIVAASVVHEISWAVANLHLSTLISSASDADIAHAKGE